MNATNLISSCPKYTELVRILRRCPPQSPLPTFGSERWKIAFASPELDTVRGELLERATAERNEPLPLLTDELYRMFSQNGERLDFERPYFERRRRLARAAVALLATRDLAYWAESFHDKLEDLFRETSWALPAHVQSISGRDPSAIDLFAAETANLMAECLAVFPQIISPTLSAQIRERLRRDIFQNYLDGTFWWLRGTNNWNAVCHQGVVGAALAIEEDAEMLASILHKAALHLPFYLSGLKSDGGCEEGPGYWSYGFGWFAMLNEQLEIRTRGVLSLFDGNEKVRAVARYGPAMCLENKHVVNFADAGQGLLRPSLLCYLGRRLDDEECMVQGLENYGRSVRGEVDFDAERADFFFWSRFFLECPCPLKDRSTRQLRKDTWFKELGVWLVRGTDRAGHFWELAAKGGHNGENHNHNDVGNFILHVDGTPLVVEIGAPEYTRDFFDVKKRYQFLAARSLGHSVPLIGGKEQGAGEEFQAAVESASTDADYVSFEIELSKAYPPEAKCLRFTRKICLRKGEGLFSLEDEITLAEPADIESAIVAAADQVAIESGSLAVIEKGGLRLALQCEGQGGWDRIELHTYRDHSGQEKQVQRLVLKSCGPALGGRLVVLGYLF